MKQIRLLFLLALALFSTAALAHEEDVFGSWKAARYLYADAFVVVSGQVHLSPSMLWLEVSCDYRQGPLVTAEVEAPIEVYEGVLTILESAYEQRGSHQACSAQLNAGPIEYIYDARREVLTLFNRMTGWRLDLVR